MSCHPASMSHDRRGQTRIPLGGEFPNPGGSLMQSESVHWSRFINQRLSRRRTLAAAGGGTVAAVLLAACGGGSSSSSSGAPASSLVTKPADTVKQAKRGGIMKDRAYSDLQSL